MWREVMVMARATEALDLSEVLETLELWRRVARLTAAAGAEAHRAMYRQATARPRHPGRRAIAADQGPAGPVTRVYKVTTNEQSQPQIDALPPDAPAPFAEACALSIILVHRDEDGYYGGNG